MQESWFHKFLGKLLTQGTIINAFCLRLWISTALQPMTTLLDSAALVTATSIEYIPHGTSQRSSLNVSSDPLGLL